MSWGGPGRHERCGRGICPVVGKTEGRTGTCHSHSRQVGAAHTLLALKADGHELTLDHGYPARMIIPAAPGVHCTKWVSKVTFDV